jgi:serine/threonine protein kinase
VRRGAGAQCSEAGGEAGGEPNCELLALKRIEKCRLQRHQWQQVTEEYGILRALDHPFVVRLSDAFETDHSFYYVMTYASLGDLTGFLGGISPTASRLVFIEVLVALEYLHSLKIVYRDLKPENTLVGADGHVLLSDFGVSKRFTSESAAAPRNGPGSTQNTIVGTYNYMSPEQLRGGSYSCWVDFWASAVLLHEMLTGTFPTLNEAGSSANLSADLAATAPAADLLRKMLMVDPSRRLGGGVDGLAAIRSHPYLASTDFGKLSRKETAGPLADQVRQPATLSGGEVLRTIPYPTRRLAAASVRRGAGGSTSRRARTAHTLTSSEETARATHSEEWERAPRPITARRRAATSPVVRR